MEAEPENRREQMSAAGGLKNRKQGLAPDFFVFPIRPSYNQQGAQQMSADKTGGAGQQDSHRLIRLERGGWLTRSR